MKKYLKCMISVFAVLCMICMFVPAKAATAPAQAKNVKIQEFTYYQYWQNNRAALKKAGLFEGEEYDAVISWSPVSSAKGYRVRLFWEKESGGSYETVVEVKRLNNGKYQFTTNGYGKRKNWISKDAKTAIYKGLSKKFTSEKLSFHVTGSTDKIRLAKVKVTVYKIVNGQRIYGKAKYVANPPIVTVHNYYVKKVSKYVTVKSDVNIRTKPWPGAGSQIVGAAGRGERLHVTGQVYNKDTGKVADWYEISWNGSKRFVNKSYTQDKPSPKPPTPPTPTKVTMTVSGVSNYLGVRSKKTTDYRYEVGRLYNGQKVKVLNRSDKTYYYVQSVDDYSLKGYVLARFLK